MPLGASVVVLALTITGCGSAPELPGQESSSPSAAASAASPAPTPSATPTGAEDALASFTDVTVRIWGSDARDQGRAYIDALVQAGFAKQRMQVTSDLSTVGNPAESLQFSVAWSDAECLVGQVGPSTGEPQTALMPRLADGSCLAGRTRTIDW